MEDACALLLPCSLLPHWEMAVVVKSCSLCPLLTKSKTKMNAAAAAAGAASTTSKQAKHIPEKGILFIIMVRECRSISIRYIPHYYYLLTGVCNGVFSRPMVGVVQPKSFSQPELTEDSKQALFFSRRNTLAKKKTTYVVRTW